MTAMSLPYRRTKPVRPTAPKTGLDVAAGLVVKNHIGAVAAYVRAVQETALTDAVESAYSNPDAPEAPVDQFQRLMRGSFRLDNARMVDSSRRDALIADLVTAVDDLALDDRLIRSMTKLPLGDLNPEQRRAMAGRALAHTIRLALDPFAPEWASELPAKLHLQQHSGYYLAVAEGADAAARAFDPVYLVVGGTGFFGSNIAVAAAESAANGDRDVIRIARNEVDGLAHPGIRFMSLDSTDGAAVGKVFDELRNGDGIHEGIGNRPVVVIHAGGIGRPAAAQIPDGMEYENCPAYVQNVVSTDNLLDVCEQHGYSFVLASTCYVTDGKTAEAVKETAEVTPLENLTYGRSKRDAELHTLKRGGFVARTSALFGPKQHPGAGKSAGMFLIEKAAEKALDPSAPPVPTLPDQRLQLTYVADAAKEMASFATRVVAAKQAGRTPVERLVHIVPSTDMTWTDFARCAAKVANPRITAEQLANLTTVYEGDNVPRPNSALLTETAGIAVRGAQWSIGACMRDAGLLPDTARQFGPSRQFDSELALRA